ncbi:1056_t:CDS:2 [Cetraspora pellucida]|uniref:1056_t:CDS:1 n=1 Tax=Cetraspora pellucida TaxID=1433469 RepID=A0A9N9P608_9GLOM|nr:1056_t:CDS:2 [Cetraspora pellucida]
MKTCQVCRKPTNKLCSRCHEVYYCGTEHQKSDWKTHKLVCIIQEKNVDPKEEKIKEYDPFYYSKLIDDSKSRGQVELFVALKKLKNSQDMSEYSLNDIRTYWDNSCRDGSVSYLELRGITQDPETKEYLIVMSYAIHGDLKNHLRHKLNDVLWGIYNNKSKRFSNAIG